MTPTQSLWTGPVILAVCISALSLAVAAGALAWQFISWRRNGPKIVVTTRSGLAGPPLRPVWFVSVQARNEGRLATEIDQIGFALPNDRIIVATEDALGQPIFTPIELSAGATKSVLYSVPGMIATLSSEGVSGKDARPFVVTGHGRFEGKRFHLGERLAPLAVPPDVSG